jgi:hypothetical protein
MVQVETDLESTQTYTDATPYLRLWAAVMTLRVKDYKSREPSNRDKARAWVSSSSELVGSFVWACHILGYDPRRVRAKLEKLRWNNDTTTQCESGSTQV